MNRRYPKGQGKLWVTGTSPLTQQFRLNDLMLVNFIHTVPLDEDGKDVVCKVRDAPKDWIDKVEESKADLTVENGTKVSGGVAGTLNSALLHSSLPPLSLYTNMNYRTQPSDNRIPGAVAPNTQSPSHSSLRHYPDQSSNTKGVASKHERCINYYYPVERGRPIG